jgi:hypothetical protein
MRKFTWSFPSHIKFDPDRALVVNLRAYFEDREFDIVVPRILESHNPKLVYLSLTAPGIIYSANMVRCAEYASFLLNSEAIPEVNKSHWP